ncbi:hypothetical protein AVEN_181766-1 [Araneus ventricosus]|uniref:Uncharacterized protein n=1 Tax=Araneus ventricosus TaxID=182803 RepID=A0A4Y2TVX5_ARAVE|nr:hypothetical protein AVEN_181766-1 [Araneus ventricosus]
MPWTRAMDEKFVKLFAMMAEMKARLEDKIEDGQEEMKAGQEELKAGQEEMKARQEEMKARQEEMKPLQVEIKDSTRRDECRIEKENGSWTR